MTLFLKPVIINTFVNTDEVLNIIIHNLIHFEKSMGLNDTQTHTHTARCVCAFMCECLHSLAVHTVFVYQHVGQ